MVVISYLIQARCGLPISTYFSAVKIKWMMEKYEAAMKGRKYLFGTVDTWLIWVRGRGKERQLAYI